MTLRGAYRPVVPLFCLALLVACSKSPREASGGPPARQEEQAAPVVAAAGSQAPLPYLSFTLRDADEGGRIVQGMPVRVAVAIEAPDGVEAPIELSPAQGSWADAVAVELRPATGSGTAVRATAVGEPDSPAATLATDRLTGGLWHFTAAQTQGLAPGEYRLAVQLAIPAGSGWTGTVEASEVSVRITPASDRPEDISLRGLALAQDALVDGRLEDAAKQLDALLAAQRENLRAWLLRGLVAERAGNPLAALACVSRARRIHDSWGGGEPHVGIEALNARVLTELFGSQASERPAAGPPAWSWVALELLEPSEAEQLAMVRAASAGGAPAEVPTPARPTPSAGPAVAAEAPAAAGGEQGPQPGTVLPAVAVSDADILRDARGQWAVAARASSEYGPADYSARQATGAPDVGNYSDSPRAWAPSASERQLEWLELTFAKPVRATDVRVRQNYTPGTIVKVEAYDVDGSGRVLWAGRDANAYPKERIGWFMLRFPRTDRPVARIRITLDTPAAKGWKEIDAVQLVGE